MRYLPCLDVGKGSGYVSAECKVNSLVRFCYIYIYIYIYILQYILCLKPHVYFAISVQLDFHSKPLGSTAFSDRSLRSYIYTVTFTEMSVFWTLKRLATATKRFSGKQKFVKFRKFLYR